MEGSAVAVLFVDGASEDDRRPLAGFAFRKASQSRNHGGHAPLDVASSAAIEPIVLDFGLEGVNGHPVDGDSILMGLHQQDFAAALSGLRAVHTGDEVVPLRSDGEAFPGDPQAGELGQFSPPLQRPNGFDASAAKCIELVVEDVGEVAISGDDFQPVADAKILGRRGEN